MNNKTIGIIVVCFLVVGGGIYLATRPGGQNQTPTPSFTPAPLPAGEPTPPPPGGSASLPATHAVAIRNFAFAESPTTIRKGDTVVWTNNDSAPHTVTGDAGGPSSATLNNGQAYSFTFMTPGTYSYHCNFHPSMRGTVIVE